MCNENEEDSIQIFLVQSFVVLWNFGKKMAHLWQCDCVTIVY